MDHDIATFLASRTEAHGDCLIWTGYLHAKGYGNARWRGKHYLVHRLAYIAAHGPIADGLVLDHLCRNRACVNVDHLQPVTNRENIMRGVSFSAENAQKTHCKRGHEFTPENTEVRKSPGRADRRNCRTCTNDRRRELRLSRR